MPMLLSRSTRQLLDELEELTRLCVEAGLTDLSNAYHGAADALARGDDALMHRWLEQADYHRHRLNKAA